MQLQRPPSRQKPPPEALHLWGGEGPGAALLQTGGRGPLLAGGAGGAPPRGTRPQSAAPATYRITRPPSGPMSRAAGEHRGAGSMPAGSRRRGAVLQTGGTRQWACLRRRGAWKRAAVPRTWAHAHALSSLSPAVAPAAPLMSAEDDARSAARPPTRQKPPPLSTLLEHDDFPPPPPAGLRRERPRPGAEQLDVVLSETGSEEDDEP
jgi:hypothetical protein